MGTTAARKARAILDNAQKVLAIEAFAASQAISYRGEAVLGKGTKEVYQEIRKHISPIEEDRIMYIDMDILDNMVKSGVFVKVVEEALGQLE